MTEKLESNLLQMVLLQQTAGEEEGDQWQSCGLTSLQPHVITGIA